MDIHEIMQTLGQYAYLALTAAKAGIKHAWTAVSTWFHALPFPTSIKLFGNDTVNKYLFFGILAFLLVMNIWAFYLFAQDAQEKVFRRSTDTVRASAYRGQLRAWFFGILDFLLKKLNKPHTPYCEAR